MNDYISNSVEPSAATWTLWAKTGAGEERHLWGLLLIHLMDTAETARLIWREWLSEETKRYVCDMSGLSFEHAEMLVVWLAGIHDIGKATPSFQSKVPHLAEHVRVAGLSHEAKCKNYPHSYMGQILVQDWLVQRGWTGSRASGLACIVGGHHGSNPTNDAVLRDIALDSETRPLAVLGDRSWALLQDELLTYIASRCGFSRFEDILKERGIASYAQILLTGLVIMADWIASNSDFFPLLSERIRWEECVVRAQTGWSHLDLPKTLKLERCHIDCEGLFHRSFPSIPQDAPLHPIQLRAYEAVCQMEEPGLIIIEAPMGCGKTEAALMCAEVLMSRFGSGGTAYLLPTRATSDAMFARVRDWLELVLAHQAGSGRQDLHLLHGKAALNNDYMTLPRWGSTWMGDHGAGGGEGDAIVAHQWFGGRKRGLLAPFVVGTVDQLLMAALRSKHAHLRHLGIAGKVIIIDEVHAYDVYMGVYLDRVLAFLGAYGASVVLLSATLPPSRRSELMNAYRGHDRLDSRRRESFPTPPRLPSGGPAYPLVTVVGRRKKEQPVYSLCMQDKRSCRVRIDFMSDDEETLLAKLKASLVDGGCVCVLRNTVARAQATYTLLRNRLNSEVRLAHSRFVAADRAQIDADLVRTLGPDNAQRPKRLVVVATQVLEQSLDIDVDLLITDIAPVDLLLQRMGRMHRHQRGAGQCERPSALRQARCIVTGIEDLAKDPPSFAKGIDAIYQKALLWATIEVLYESRDGDNCLTLPEDIAPLVESVYEKHCEIPESWEQSMVEADKKMSLNIETRRNAARQWLLSKPLRFNLNGWMRSNLNIDEETYGRAAVRDSEESIEVVVVRQTDAGLELLPWIADRLGVSTQLGNGSDVPPDDVAHAAALCTVSLPPRLSAPWCSEKVIAALEMNAVFEGWQDSRWLAGTLPLVINEQGVATIGWEGHEFLLRYTREMGLLLVEERRLS